MLLMQSPSEVSQFDKIDAKTITQASVFNAGLYEFNARDRQVGPNDTKMSDNEAFLAYTQSNEDDD